MKFSHIADVHLGGWREPELAEMNTQAFVKAIDITLERRSDFVLLCGDLFNTSIPSIDVLKTAVTQLKRLKEAGIPTYSVAGSHDYSPSGKTMLEVLEEAGLLKNVCRGDVEDGKLKLKFTTDHKTGAKITGIVGRKGMLDKRYYESLDTENLNAEAGYKIFLFHTAITELKTEDLEKMDSTPLSLLPRGFDYYAGGHVHIVRNERIDGYKNVVYPGPTFPNSFAELEKLGSGGFYFYADGKTEYIKIEIAGTLMIDQDCDMKTPILASEELLEKINNAASAGKIVLLRLHGMLDSGRMSDINLKEMTSILGAKGARCVLKNTTKLSTKEFGEIKVKAESAEQTEAVVIQENIGQSGIKIGDEKEVIDLMMSSLDTEKKEGEKSADYERRVGEEARKIFNL